MKFAKPICALGLVLSSLAAACSDDSSSGGQAGSGGADSGAGGSAGAVDAGSDASGGADAALDAPPSDGQAPKPTPDEIGFAAHASLPQGEQLLFSDWNANPNTLSSIRLDGSGETAIFSAYRIWALGASHDASKLAFACGDPLQEQHYGLNLGDAIQHTWLYDVASQSASVLAWGNINDECHAFAANDQRIYVCRRYDFAKTPSGAFTNKGYQLGRIDVASGGFEFLTPESALLELHPQPTADESAVYYTIIEIAGGSQTRKIVKKQLPGGEPSVIRDKASAPVLSPDGTRILFANTEDQSALYTMDTDGGDLVKVSSRAGTNASWSPDGSRIAFLYGETQTCIHIETVAADGSEVDSPVRVRDCGNAFITELAWIDRP